MAAKHNHREPLIIQILHERNSDDGCGITVWLDGVKIEDFHVENVDPGAGWHHAEWDERIAEAQASVGIDDNTFPDALVAALQAAADSPHIRED